MDSSTADQLRNEFESALSAIISAIAQATQQYQVSGAFKTKLKALLTGEVIPAGGGGCQYINGNRICSIVSPESCTPEMVPERAEQFGTEIASILSSTMDLLGQSIQDTGESFEVHFFIETGTLNSEQPVVCQWDRDISEINILQCSKP
jgi:hypothetical protein